MTGYLAIVGWAALFAGQLGSWVAGKHYYGWLIGSASAASWAFVNGSLRLFPALVSSSLAAIIAFRNWFIGRKKALSRNCQWCKEPTDGLAVCRLCRGTDRYLRANSRLARLLGKLGVNYIRR